MMWRYYELLTDVQLPEIEKMKGESHPMEAKKELARRIVTDFHWADAATKAAEDWAKQFQKDAVPEDVEEVEVKIFRNRILQTDASNWINYWPGRPGGLGQRRRAEAKAKFSKVDGGVGRA